MNRNEDVSMRDEQPFTEGFAKVVSIHKYEYADINKIIALKDVTSQPHESIRLLNFIQNSMNIQ